MRRFTATILTSLKLPEFKNLLVSADCIKSFMRTPQSHSLFLLALKKPLSVFVKLKSLRRNLKIYFPSIYLTQHIEKSAHHLDCNQPSAEIILDSTLPSMRLSST